LQEHLQLALKKEMLLLGHSRTFFSNACKHRSTEQEQTAKIAPETVAIKYDNPFFALGPKYFITAPWDMIVILHDKKNAIISIIIRLMIK
jgi:hypothetical protein